MYIPITPYKIKKAWRYFRHFGAKAFFAHLTERIKPEVVSYSKWYENHRAGEKDIAKLVKQNKEDDPLFSIVVAAYETDEKYMRELIDSVIAQTYENWELCIADASDKTDTVKTAVSSYEDERVKYFKLSENKSIADNMNEALRQATGKYVGFADHDDLLAADCLRLVVNAALSEEADLIYTDEDKVDGDGKRHFQPNLKPDFNLDLLRSNNYITHFLCIRRDLLDLVGEFDSEYDGAQDYDFILRASEKAKKISHVPRVLYHWRTHEKSTSDNPESKAYAYDAGGRAIEAHLARVGTCGEVERLPEFGFYRVKYKLKEEKKISVIIPNKDEVASLKNCIDALDKTDYDNFEVIIVENNSTEDSTFEYYKELEKDERIKVVVWEDEFNYSAINNFGVKHSNGEYLLFLNNDVRMSIDGGWLKEMASVLSRDDVGIVGCKLYYPNDRIQHAGIIIGIGGVAGSVFTDMPRARKGYMNKASLIQDLSAVTAACMLMKRDVFDEVGGFTEELKIAFNDVDLCLKVRDKGMLVVYDPFAEGYHDESLSRGSEDTEEKRRRFQSEIEYMRCNWIDILKNGDPYYNKNLSLKRWDYSLRE